MSTSTIGEQGFTCFSEIFTAFELGHIERQMEELPSVGSRCLLDQDWCQGLARELQNRLIPQLPMLRKLSAVQCTYFNKSIEMNWLVAFHQDLSIPVDDKTSSTYPGWSRKEGITFVQASDDVLSEMLALRLHIDDATTENGPLRVLSHTHLAGKLSPQHIDHYRLSCPSTSVVLKKGSVFAMRPLLLHASSKSMTNHPRRVLHFLFGPRSLPAPLRWRNSIACRTSKR